MDSNSWRTLRRKLVVVFLCLGFLFTSFVLPLQEAQARTYSQIRSSNKVVYQAKRWMGYRYRFGADGPWDRAFDCSSYTRYIYRKVGVYLPRTSRSQARVGRYIGKIRYLRKGDLVFFDASRTRGRRGAVDHVGIYIGNGRVIHTYKRGVGVTVSRLRGYWARSFLFGRRVI